MNISLNISLVVRRNEVYCSLVMWILVTIEKNFSATAILLIHVYSAFYVYVAVHVKMIFICRLYAYLSAGF
jgi:hypothetical protein